MRRDFTYIDDIVAGVIASLDHPPADDGLSKAGGFTPAPPLQYRQQPARAPDGIDRRDREKACGRKAELNLLPMQDGDVHETYADIAAIAGELGYTPRTDIRTGVGHFVDWYRNFYGVWRLDEPRDQNARERQPRLRLAPERAHMRGEPKAIGNSAGPCSRRSTVRQRSRR